MTSRHSTESSFPASAPADLAGPLPVAAFARDLPLAAAAAGRHGRGLALIVLRHLGRGRHADERARAASRAAPGFAYELEPGAFAVLIPGATVVDACAAAAGIEARAGGGLLRRGVTIDAGIALFVPGAAAQGLFDAAALALARAQAAGGGICVATARAVLRGAPAG